MTREQGIPLPRRLGQAGAGLGHARAQTLEPIGGGRLERAAVAEDGGLFAQPLIDATGEHHDAVGTLAIGESGVGLVIDQPVQAKDLIAVGAGPTHSPSIILAGPLAELSDRELDVCLALVDAVVGPHECRARSAAHVVRGLQ